MYLSPLVKTDELMSGIQRVLEDMVDLHGIMY